MMPIDHSFYVYSAWGIAILVLLAVTSYTWIESLSLRRELKRLEAQGIRRRSSEPSGDAT
ncbi:heme exporter protein CcmD [Rhizobium sp. LjRoot254]|uniref:heme exporter protein CcmD n=1 Tax=Rhizobium sp. LjRoot254 TaxID=3342297 RepID=UPI003F4F71ED